MPTASRRTHLIGVGPLGAMAGALVVALGLGLAASLENPLRPQVQMLLTATWLPAVAVVAVLIVLAVAVYQTVGQIAGVAGHRPEPLLPEPALPVCRRPRPVVTFFAVEPGVGATTICFNLGVLLATEGLVREGDVTRRPRPVCLVEAGPLCDRLGLDPAPLAGYLARNPVSIADELISLAVRHRSGCELLCLSEGALNGQRLKLMVPILRRYYEVILLDCPAGDRWLAEVAVDLSELVLPVTIPSSRSASSGAVWAEEAWRRGWEGKTAVVVNRIEHAARVPDGLVSGFLHQLHLPEDPLAAASDLHGLPWVLAFGSVAGRELARAAHDAFPQLLAGGERVAA